MAIKLRDVRQYFQDIAEDLGYNKHYDGFATDNIPGTQFDLTYHVEAFSFNTSSQNQLDLEVTAPSVVRLYFKAYRDVDDGILDATDAGEAYIEEALKSENRLNSTNIKNVICNGIFIEPYATTNDNYVVCRIEFESTIYKGIC